jgi:hypothetical protein
MVGTTPTDWPLAFQVLAICLAGFIVLNISILPLGSSGPFAPGPHRGQTPPEAAHGP